MIPASSWRRRGENGSYVERVAKPSRRADVLVINTESRAMPADQAASAVYAALSPWCETSPAPLVYKNRLHISRQYRRRSDGGHARQSAKTGRYRRRDPAAGRTTLEGKCLVNGVPLLETEFASDPKTPIVSSRIAEIVALQSEILCMKSFAGCPTRRVKRLTYGLCG